MIGQRLRSGYTNLGPIAPHPVSAVIILTDRADGTKWFVSSDIALQHLSISTDYASIARLDGFREYAADDGPKMDEDGEFTLFVRAGRIGVDYNPFPLATIARDDAPPYLRITDIQRKLFINTLNTLTVHIGYVE